MGRVYRPVHSATSIVIPLTQYQDQVNCKPTDNFVSVYKNANAYLFQFIH